MSTYQFLRRKRTLVNLFLGLAAGLLFLQFTFHPLGDGGLKLNGGGYHETRGLNVLPPDFPENKEDWPFLWGENEYVVNLGASHIFSVNAVNDHLKEK